MRAATNLRWIARIIFLLAVALSGAYWWMLSGDNARLRADAIEQGSKRATQLADLQAQHIDALLLGIDQSLRQFRDAFQVGNIAGAEEIAKNVIRTFPTGAVAHLSRINTKGYYSAYTTAQTAAPLSESVYIGDREYFRFHQQEGSKDLLFISNPVVSRVLHRWVILVTRPIIKAGRFDGVAAISLYPEYFSKMLAKLEMGQRDVGAVFYADGAYLARSRDLDEVLGKTVHANRPFIGVGTAAHGVFRDVATADKVRRIFAWRKLSLYPLIVVIGLDEGALLAPVEQTIAATRAHSAIGTAFLLLLTAALSLLLMRAARQQKLLQDSEARLDELAELSHTWAWEVNADGLYTYASHVVQDVLGFQPDEVVGKKYFYDLHPEDGRDAFKAKTLQVFASRESFVNFINPVSAKDETVLWVSTNGIPVVDDDGRLLGYRGSDSDITVRRQAEAALSHSLSLTDAALDASDDGILLIDLQGKIVRWNQRFVELWRVPSELLDTTVTDPVLGYALTQVADADAFARKVMDLYARPEESSFDLIPLADGRIFERHSRPFRIGEEVKGRFWAFRDVTERKRAEAALQKSEANFRTLFSEMLDGFAHHEIICDAEGNPVDYRFMAVNPAFTRMTGLKPEDIIGRTVMEVLPGTELHWIESFGKVALKGEAVAFENYSGKLNKHFQVTAFQPAPNQFACIFADVTERKRSEELINQLAFYDQLTTLPNRTLLQDRVRQAMAASARNGHHGALLLIDLDNFKSLNDTLGHDMGDILLKQVAQRLIDSVRAEDTVARLGGDEFVIMLVGLSENQAEAASQTELVGEKIQAALNLVYQLNDISYKISPSIGASLFHGYQTSLKICSSSPIWPCAAPRMPGATRFVSLIRKWKTSSCIAPGSKRSCANPSRMRILCSIISRRWRAVR